MALPILYSFRRCPYAMRARMAIVRTGFKIEHREVILRDRPAHMMEISPKGTVPVLLLPDGTVIEESLEIMEFVQSWNLNEEESDAFGDENSHWFTDKRETRGGGVGENGRFAFVANATVECNDQK